MRFNHQLAERGSFGLSALSFDFIIIGAGIVGLTTAYALKKRFPSAHIAVLEKEPLPGMHASGRNSGVLHSGIYYSSDTLKSQLCSKGAAKMREFAAEYNIPFIRSGKVIIATSERDIATLEILLRNAKDNNIRVERLDETGVREMEPHANVYKMGIYSPDTAVIDSKEVINKLRVLLTQLGAQLLFDQPVMHIFPDRKCIKTRAGNYSYGYLLNCAGAHADTIAAKFGIGKDYALVPFKGLYFKLIPNRAHLVRSNIYPTPDISLPFLGIHFTRVIGGDVYVGPTAIPALGRENYGLLEGARLNEGLKIFRQMASLYIGNQNNFRRLVREEIRKYNKTNFLEAARKLVPELTASDLVASTKVGIRPQLVNLRKQKLEMDFVIEQTPDSMHVLNAISPAFTSAFAFAELLVTRIS